MTLGSKLTKNEGGGLNLKYIEPMSLTSFDEAIL